MNRYMGSTNKIDRSETRPQRVGGFFRSLASGALREFQEYLPGLLSGARVVVRRAAGSQQHPDSCGRLRKDIGELERWEAADPVDRKAGGVAGANVSTARQLP